MPEDADPTQTDFSVRSIQRKCRGCDQHRILALRYDGMVPHGLFCDPCWDIRHTKLALRRTLLRIL